MSSDVLRAGSRKVRVSRADKVFFPDDGVTKGQLAEYYRQVGKTVAGHVRGRPLALERYPDGIGGERIFQKNVPAHYPDWIRSVEVPKKDGGVTVHAVGHDVATLVYLADQGCITPHAWSSRVDDLDRPDRLVFDLDPADADVDRLRAAAGDVRGVLDELGLSAWLMATGSRGFHVVSPLRREEDFDGVRDFARQVATALAERDPANLTAEQRKDQRGSRIFVDYLRNGYAQTSVAPYAVRARPGAPVATPLSWDELDEARPDRFDIGSVLERLRDLGDPWSGFLRRGRSLTNARKRLEELRETAATRE